MCKSCKSCKTCESARITLGLWTTYDSPKCIYCTARLWQQIDKLRTPTSAQILARRRVVLEEAVAFGHDESAIMELAGRKELAMEPLEAIRRKRNE